MESQHADKMHRPDHQPECNSPCHHPDDFSAAGAFPHAFGMNQRGERAENGDQDGKCYQIRIPDYWHTYSFRSDVESEFRSAVFESNMLVNPNKIYETAFGFNCLNPIV